MSTEVRRIVAASGLILLLCGLGKSQTTPLPFVEELHFKAVCTAALTKPLPAAAATAQARENFSVAECDEKAAYYGFGKPPHYKQALQCAYRHRSHPDRQVGSFVDGAGTLAMLYVNGYGVMREYGLAIRFSCELENVGGQNTSERIAVLKALQNGTLPAGTLFDLCDEQGSGTMGSYCEWLQQKQADVGARRLVMLRARLPEKAQTILPALEAAKPLLKLCVCRNTTVAAPAVRVGLRRLTKASCASSS